MSSHKARQRARLAENLCKRDSEAFYKLSGMYSKYLHKVKTLIDAATVAQKWMTSHHLCEEQDCDLCNSQARLKSALEDMNE